MRKIIILFPLVLSLFSFLKSQEPIIIDHNSRILSDIPERWIDSAKTNLHIGYGHTSHGSQLATGMDALESFFTDGTFDWSNYGGTGRLHMFEGDMWGNGGYLERDVGYVGWDDETREYLDANPDCNVIIWAWCGLENTVVDRDILTHYLQPMNQLEQEYPNVAFVYMTGPLDGLGPNGAVKQANDSIRNFCTENNKILYDFADIEKYDPDANTDYQQYGVDDECDYDPDGETPYNRTENWAENWINENPGDTLTLLTGEAIQDDCSFGHTHCLNCVLKGIAAWQLWARIAGWEGPPEAPDDSTSSFTAENGFWNDPGNWNNGVPDPSTLATIMENNSVTIDNNAQCSTLTVKPNATVIINQGDTLFTNHIVLKTSNSDTSTAKLLNYGWIEATNGVSIEKLINKNTWEGISPPIKDGQSGLFNATDEELYLWDVSGPEYIQITNNSTELETMQGYQYRNSNDTIIVLKGTLNQGVQQYDLKINQQDTLNKHWNFIGNPYPAKVDWTHDSWDKTHVANSFYFHSKASDQPHAYVNGISNPVKSSNGYIPEMGAFWVYAKNEGIFLVDKVSQIQNSNQKHSEKQKQQKSIRFKISKDEEAYETIILFNNSATSGFDSEYDAFHLTIPQVKNTLSPGLFTLDSNSNLLAINSLPEKDTINISMGYTILNSGSYTIEATEINDINYTLYLTDQQRGKKISITENDYSFIAQRGTQIKRFNITNKISDTSTFVTPVATNSLFNIFGRDRTVFITNKNPMKARVRIVDITGRPVYDNILMLGGYKAITVRRTGLYIIIVQTTKLNQVEKIFID